MKPDQADRQLLTLLRQDARRHASLLVEALDELIDGIGMLDGVARTTSSIILATNVQH